MVLLRHQGLSPLTLMVVIVDMLTGGAGKTDSTDVTYATPCSFLVDCIKVFPRCHLYDPM